MFMDKVKTEFLEKEYLKPWVWLTYIRNIFLVWTHREDELHKFLEHLNSFHHNLKFTLECARQELDFLDVTVKFNNNEFAKDCCKPTDDHQYLHYNSFHPERMENLVPIVKDFELKDYALRKHPWPIT